MKEIEKEEGLAINKFIWITGSEKISTMMTSSEAPSQIDKLVE
jgi:hypothetical protein